MRIPIAERPGRTTERAHTILSQSVQALAFPVLGTGLLVILAGCGPLLYIRFAPQMFFMFGMLGFYPFGFSLFVLYAYMGSWVGGNASPPLRAERMRGLPRLNQFGSDVAGRPWLLRHLILAMLPYVIYRWGAIPTDGGMLGFLVKIVGLGLGAIRLNALDWTLIVLERCTWLGHPAGFRYGRWRLHPKRVGLHSRAWPRMSPLSFGHRRLRNRPCRPGSSETFFGGNS